MALGREFLLLADVEVSFPNGARKTTREAIIRKSSIMFVGEKSDSGSAAKKTNRQLNYRVKPKTPFSAEIHLPLYVLKGHIYGEVWQQILDVVDKADKFIALTDVQISHTLNNAELNFDFVAVNRDKIIYVGEPANAAEPSLQ